MSDRATLQAPRELVDAWRPDVAEMLSSSVLVEERRRLAFFHETFFDYTFARRFYGRGRTLPELLAVDQLLFRRAQVRQILAYEREGSHETYGADLRFLLTNPSIRFHLRDIVLAWLSAVDEPLDVEWELVSELMSSDQPAISRRARRTVTGAGWFRRLDAEGRLEQWLTDPETEKLALSAVAAGQAANPGRAAELLDVHRRRSKAAADAVSSLLQRTDLADGRAGFELLLAMLDDAQRDLARHDFFSVKHNLAETHPDWVCELLRAYLRNRLRAADRAEVANPFGLGSEIIPRQLYIGELVTGAAKGAPCDYVELVLPEMVTLMKRTARADDSDALEPIKDDAWGFARYDRLGDALENDLLAGAEFAVRALAVDDVAAFTALLDRHANTRYETLCAILFEGIRANPTALADRAADFLLGDLRRLHVSRGAEDQWGSRQLLEATTPYCSAGRFAALEREIMDLFTEWERSKGGRRTRGYAQFVLLSAMARDRLSQAGRRRLQEWERKFAGWRFDPVGVQGGVVGSPISADATRLMKDDHWLGAFRKYNTERGDRVDFLKGGAHELSQELQARAQEDPVRFIQLAERMPDDTNVFYFDALLRGVAASDQEVPLEATLVLVERCHALPDRPCGRWIAHPIRCHIDQPMLQRLAEILTWYTINDPDPPELSDDFSGEISDAKRVELQGLNSVRGAIACDIAPHIHKHEANADTLAAAIARLVTDPSGAVRGMAIRPLTALMRHRPEEAVELFVELASHPDDRILAGREAHEFLRYAGGLHFGRLRPVVERMVQSPLAAVRTQGAVHAALAALDESAAQDLVDTCMAGKPALRLGVARVNAANVKNSRYRGRCEFQLVRLFDDPDENVRQAAASCLRELAAESFAASAALVEVFVDSAAFADRHGAEALLHSLELAEAPPPHLALLCCSALLDSHLATDDAIGGGLIDVSELAVRAYADAAADDGRHAALDVIDRALAVDAYGVPRALAEHDR